MIPALRERIAKGDAVASCQLAREFDFCEGAEDKAEYLSRIDTHRKTPPSPDRTDPASTLTDLAKIRAEYCVGVSTISPAERIGLWRQAALKGHVSSMLQYGSGLAFGYNQTLATVDELRTYKSEGPELVERVAQKGGFQANLMLARAYAPHLTAPDRMPLLRQAVAKSASTSLAYYKIAKELRSTTTETAPTDLALETEMKPLLWSMSPQELAESEQKFRFLRGKIERGDRAIVDIDALNNADVNQPVPGMELCGSGGVLR
ncbi:hypothetical protein [Lysobacter antibioticus]|uniref:hypothetical protein n=1 Tax=Lysobacter antibioticus TaxID=84531 RepID=UPI00126A28CE|nr:hypothetical protein [Lysobacter antibioticus]